jgi:hypothetical protein
MTRLKNHAVLLFMLSLAAVLSSCSSGGGGGGAAPTTRQWTYMVYMGADNNLANAGLTDLNEMESVGSTAEVAIVVQGVSPAYTQIQGLTPKQPSLVVNDNNPDARIE